MLSDSYSTAPNVIWDAIRSMFSILDRVFFGLLGLVYQLFFNVASSDILSGDTIMKFYSRVQLILGVFMMFQLAMIIIKGIVNPDTFTDSKSGFGNLIMRICVALFLLTSLVPINIPSPQNEYEKQLNNHGLLFGTLYSLQHRILENNTLGRLILGNNGESDNYVSTNGNYSESLKKSSRIFTTTILKGFYRINLLPEDSRPDRCKEVDDPATINECRMCQSGIDPVIEIYKKIDADPDDIISTVNENCNINFNILNYIPLLSSFSDDRRYAISYTPVLSTITAIVFTFILISFTVDIAVRAIKLALLRLIAPIPIISYMDPKGSKDNAFNSWVKVLTSTYIDLFVRLAIVYFVLFLIEQIIVEGIIVPKDTSGILKVFTYIMIFIGMFMFAKQAPKFLRQALGLKDSDFKLFGGMSGIVAAAGMVGSAAANFRAAAEENAERHPGQTVANFGRNVGSALAGAIGGGVAGFGAAGGKDASISKVLQAQNQRNTKRASHSTLPGRIGDSVYGAFTGRSLADRDQMILDANNKAFDEMKKYKNVAEEEALKQKNEYGSYNGKNFNYNRLQAALQAARGSGSDTFNYSDGVNSYTGLSIADFDENVMNDIKSEQAENYVKHQLSKVGYNEATHTYDSDGYSRNGTLWNQYEAANRAAIDASLNREGKNAAGDIIAGFNGQYKNNKQNMGRAKDRSTELSTSMETIMHRANKQK